MDGKQLLVFLSMANSMANSKANSVAWSMTKSMAKDSMATAWLQHGYSMATAWLQHGYSMAKSTASSIANSNFMANHPLQRNQIMAHKKVIELVTRKVIVTE